MKPENHAIRQLEKQLEGASPEVREQMERVILALKACVMNADDPAALATAQRFLHIEVGTLNDILRKPS